MTWKNIQTKDSNKLKKDRNILRERKERNKIKKLIQEMKMGINKKEKLMKSQFCFRVENRIRAGRQGREIGSHHKGQ